MNSRQLICLLFLGELILSGFWYAGGAVTAMFLLVAAVVLGHTVLVQHAIKLYALSRLMLLYLLWLFAVRYSSAVPAAAQMTLAALAGLPVMYLFATNMPVFTEVWKFLRGGFFLLGVVLATWAICQVFYHIGYGYANGPFQDRNVFAALMNLLWFPAISLFLTDEKKPYHLRLPILGGLFIICTALFATTSRGGILTWVLLMPVLLWLAYRHHLLRRRAILIVIVAALAYLCSALLLNASIADRTFELAQDNSVGTRLLLWQSTIKMALAHPVAGSGWGTFANYYPAYRVPAEVWSAGFFAHNDYLQLAAEGGIAALLLQVAVLCGVLMQLWRSLKQPFSSETLESVTLLLGVLALFIHAAVNFIFYHAFINIIAGLYLARSALLTEQFPTSARLGFYRVNPLFRYFFITAIIVLVALPYAANLLAQTINKQTNVKIGNLVSRDFTAYQFAELIAAIQPQERIAQETLLQTAELALEDDAFISRMGEDYYRKLLMQTLRQFDSARALAANDPTIGVREAKLLIRHHAAFADGDAYLMAHRILNESLKANPYHVDSIITLSRLQSIEGHPAEALRTIEHAENYILMSRDKQLIHVELLRQRAAPAIVPELDAIDKALRKLRTGPETGNVLILPHGYYENIDAELEAIACQIQH